MQLTDIGNLGYHLYTHSEGLGIVGEGFDTYGSINTRLRGLFGVHNFLPREYFERFGQSIPRQHGFEKAWGVQLVQVTTLPLELKVTEQHYRKVLREERTRGLGGLLGRKTTIEDFIPEYVERLYRTSEVLEKAEKDEPAYVAQWGVPWFVGFGQDKRRGMYFLFSALMGESDAPTVTRAIQDNPEIVRETGESVFPDLFVALGKRYTL